MSRVRGGFARLGRLRLVVLVVLVGAGSGVAIGAGTSTPDASKPRPAPIDLLADGPPTPYVAAVAETAAPVGTTKKRKGSRKAGAEYYRRTAARRVPKAAEAGFEPLYREAGRVYNVDWRLIASIHRQETAFSTVPGTYRGLNSFGCCGGPMQFNVTNGPVSTWDGYKQAFRAGDRPKSYPHRTKNHPSLYDDFDAMMAAGKLLADGGARGGLDGGSWLAAYGYYGHDNFGVTYASQVVARAQGWQRDGFCANCALDQGLVSALDDAYGVSARQELAAADERRKAEKERKKKPKEKRKQAKEKAKREKARRQKAAREAEREAASTPKPSGSKSPSGAATTSPAKSPSTPSKPTTSGTTTPTTTAPPAEPTAPAPAPACANALKQALGRC